MSILQDAQTTIDGPRQAMYGDPVEHMRRVAGAWSSILDHDVTDHEVALCMAALKLVRDSHRVAHDNLVDAAGYVAIASRCVDLLYIENPPMPAPQADEHPCQTGGDCACDGGCKPTVNLDHPERRVHYPRPVWGTSTLLGNRTTDDLSDSV